MKTHSQWGFRMLESVRRSAQAAGVALCLGALSQAAMAADDAPRAGDAKTGATRTGCVDVEVNGQRSPSYDCLTNQLQPASAPGAQRGPGLESEEIANKPSNQIGGQFNWSGTSQRMGNTFGSSATPQRPDTPPPSAPVVRPGR